MVERRFRKGDRVDFFDGRKPNGTPGTVKRVIITRKYVIDWDDATNGEDPYEAHELTGSPTLDPGERHTP